ncbi:MAG: CsgG/HfaB family protein [Pseudomonadota bacterium]
MSINSLSIKLHLLITSLLFTVSQPVFANSNKQAEAPAYGGPRHVVAVLPFANRVQNIYGGYEIGEGLSEILITELMRTQRFQLVERELIGNIVQEQELGMTGLTNSNVGPQTGQLSGAQFMIRGAVTEFNDQAGGGGIKLSYSKAEAGTKSSKAYVGIDVRLVDNATGQIYASYNAHAEAVSRGLSLAAVVSEFGEDFKFGASHFNNTPIGKATREAMSDIVDFIIAESANIPWQGMLIQALPNEAYVNRGQNTNLKNGDELVVFSPGIPLIDPETGFNLGSVEKRVCTITVTDVHERFSIAKRGSECGTAVLKRGDIVRFP